MTRSKLRFGPRVPSRALLVDGGRPSAWAFPVIVAVDTNAVVSALLSPKGPPAQLLQAILADRVRHAFDSRMIEELSEVIRRPKFAARISAQTASAILDSLTKLGTEIASVPRYPGGLIDEGDRPFLEVAIACDGILITGNVRHFPSEAPVRIVSPVEALGVLGLQTVATPGAN